MSSKWWSRLRWLGVNLARMIFSVIFVLSGIVKLTDPVGTQYKIEDYAQAMGLISLIPGYMPLLLAVILALFEFDLGICLFFGLHRKRVTRLAFFFLLFMTPFTLYLALTNPVSDCGCFGDALVLTNWQTFFKNIFLLSLAFPMLFNYRLLTRLVLERNQWLITLYSKVFGFVFACINLYGLPVMDFRPYHVGADLLQKMSTPQRSSDVVTYFLMEKDGIRKEFTLENYPDSTWNLVDTRTVGLDNQDILPEITDFCMIRASDSLDITYQFLEQEGYKFLLVAPFLEQADDGAMDRIAGVYDYAVQYGYPFYCLTASGDSAMHRWSEMTGAEYPYCHTDDIVLKTMIRSNPGLILLRGSEVVNKWPHTSFPEAERLTAPLEELTELMPLRESKYWRVLRILLWYLLPLMAVTIADRLWLGLKMRELHKHRV